MLLGLIGVAVLTVEPVLPPELQPLGFLVGYCWRGTAGKEVETHCYESVLGGRHIRDRFTIRRNGQTVEGERLFSPRTSPFGIHIAFTEWTSDRPLRRGTVAMDYEGFQLLEEEIDGQSIAYRGIGRLRYVNEVSYVETSIQGHHPQLDPWKEFRRSTALTSRKHPAGR
jgi:hypothetical protein